MNSFATSTQYKNWIKTEEEIQKIEKNKIERIFKRINDVNSLIKKENEKKSLHNNNMDIENNSQSNKDSENKDFKRYISPKQLITLDDEKILIVYYSNKLIKILNNQKDKSTSLKNTTLSYFRRFFLKKSVLDYDPDFLMAAAFFLGSKTAQLNYTFVDTEKLFVVVKNREKKFFEYEFFLSTILDYDFFVFSPYQALLGFLYNLEQKEFFLAQSSENYVNPNDFKQECMDIIDKMYLTNNIFLYTYSEIALASLFIKCEQKNIDIINIAEKLELDKIINVKEFLENAFIFMKKNLELIPKYESVEEEHHKAKEIYKKIIDFHKSFPQYQKKLDHERNALKKKMKDFTDDFEKNEKPILKALNKK